MTDQFENIRWFNTRQAATYCGYSSPGAFRKVASAHSVPKCGPKRNRYDRLDLDGWMKAPGCFIEEACPSASSSGRVAAPFEPIRNMMVFGVYSGGGEEAKKVHSEANSWRSHEMERIRELRKKEALI